MPTLTIINEMKNCKTVVRESFAPDGSRLLEIFGVDVLHGDSELAGALDNGEKVPDSNVHLDLRTAAKSTDDEFDGNAHLIPDGDPLADL